MVRTLLVDLIVFGSLSGFSGFLLIRMAGASRSVGPPLIAVPRGGFAVTVEMTNLLKFEPHEVTIQAGQTVVWKNKSFLAHTVTADPDLAANQDDVLLPEGADAFNSLLIDPNESWSRSFPVPGRYRYYCIPHEATGMVGEVVVKPR